MTHWATTRQGYTYDALNRLKSVKEYFKNYSQAESQQSVQTYDYDRWGNRTINAAQTSGTGINNTAFEVETARNRLYSRGDLAPELPEDQMRIRYDKAGNQVKDTYTGYGTATFDGDNRIVGIQDNLGGSSTYTYNANAQRVRRKSNNQETWQIYGIDGEWWRSMRPTPPSVLRRRNMAIAMGTFMMTPGLMLNGTTDGLIGSIVHDAIHKAQNNAGKDSGGRKAEMAASSFALGVALKLELNEVTIQNLCTDAKFGHKPPSNNPYKEPKKKK